METEVYVRAGEVKIYGCSYLKYSTVYRINFYSDPPFGQTRIGETHQLISEFGGHLDLRK